jgi:hypothetical protein
VFWDFFDSIGHSRRFDSLSMTSGLPSSAELLGAVGLSQRCQLPKLLDEASPESVLHHLKPKPECGRRDSLAPSRPRDNSVDRRPTYRIGRCVRWALVEQLACRAPERPIQVPGSGGKFRRRPDRRGDSDVHSNQDTVCRKFVCSWIWAYARQNNTSLRHDVHQVRAPIVIEAGPS